MSWKTRYLTGAAFALTGATLWGLSGTVSSALFTVYMMPYLSLLTVRMIISGGLLYIVLRPKFPAEKRALFLLFAFNLMAVQLTYLAAIRYTNAPTATMLQYLFLPIVFIFELAMHRIRPSAILYTTMVVSIFGIFELTTSFPLKGISLVINPAGFLFGIVSAVTAALYVLLSAPLIKSMGAVNSVLWGLLIGGVMSIPLGLSPTIAYFSALRLSDLLAVSLLILFVALFGTMLAFTLFIKSMETISATQASIAGTMEPVAAALSSLLFLGVLMSAQQYFGGALIIASIIIAQKTNAVSVRGSGPELRI
jgi:drug/metabolite transporter (DMT)-like permease